MRSLTRAFAGASIGATRADRRPRGRGARRSRAQQCRRHTPSSCKRTTRLATRCSRTRARPTERLTADGTFATGGVGDTQPGAVVDPLASQGSLAYDAHSHLLLVVNAGSDSVSVFLVDGTQLSLRQVVSSGGAFPSSVTIHGDLAYVLDTGGAGAVQGYRIAGAQLHAIEGSNRSLGLANDNPPAFLQSPGQVG